MKFRRIDLNLLVALEALLDECSVTRAAERVHLSQAAMSNALTRLRDALGDELLVRVGQRMMMTDRARILHDEVREVLRKIDMRILVPHAFDPSQQEREVQCMMSDVMTQTFFRRLTRHIGQKAPGIRFVARPIEDPPHAWLAQGRIDFLMMPRQYASSDHPMIELYREGFDCLVDPQNPLVAEGLTAESYLKATHVILELGPQRKTSADRAAIEQRHGPLTAGVKVYNHGAVPWMVKGSGWIGTLPSSLAHQYCEALGLVRLPLPIDVLPNTLVLQWGKYAEEDACLDWLGKEIEAYASTQWRHLQHESFGRYA
ncbi:LysR family transcriptional regulator [Allorhizobium undicola]|uniref:LysR family transcriptional regulator n=1 Tax=Allorhizobium undicola TaxID=78527 RepID=UPI00068695C5|nr:LysR family transcriptional regulator [Allorhizobium undicola]